MSSEQLTAMSLQAADFKAWIWDLWRFLNGCHLEEKIFLSDVPPSSVRFHSLEKTTLHTTNLIVK